MTILFAATLFGAMVATFAGGMALGICLTVDRRLRSRAIEVEIVSNGREERMPWATETVSHGAQEPFM